MSIYEKKKEKIFCVFLCSSINFFLKFISLQFCLVIVFNEFYVFKRLMFLNKLMICEHIKCSDNYRLKRNVSILTKI